MKLQREPNICRHRHVGIEGVVLEDHGDVTVLGGQLVDGPIADPDRARRDLLEPGDHAKRRCLAASRRTDQHHELAVVDGKAELGDGDRPVRVHLGDAIELYRAHDPDLLSDRRCPRLT